MEKTLIYVAKSYEGKDRKKLIHALELMLLMNSDKEREVALLKDILSVKSVEELREEGFSEDVIEAVMAMDKKPRENREKYMGRVADNGIASMVMHGELLIFLTEEDDGRRPSAAKTKELKQANEFLMFLLNGNKQKGGDEDGRK